MNEKFKGQLLAIIGEEANIDTEIDQTLYPKPDWASHQIVRASGLVEDISQSGCGHPNAGWLKIHDPTGELGYGIHGCDGECCPEMKKEIKRAYKEKYGEEPDVPSTESERCVSTEPYQELWDAELRKRVIKEYDENSEGD